jgi:hypothetical protein
LISSPFIQNCAVAVTFGQDIILTALIPPGLYLAVAAIFKVVDVDGQINGKQLKRAIRLVVLISRVSVYGHILLLIQVGISKGTAIRFEMVHILKLFQLLMTHIYLHSMAACITLTLLERFRRSICSQTLSFSKSIFPSAFVLHEFILDSINLLFLFELSK